MTGLKGWACPECGSDDVVVETPRRSWSLVGAEVGFCRDCGYKSSLRYFVMLVEGDERVPVEYEEGE